MDPPGRNDTVPGPNGFIFPDMGEYIGPYLCFPSSYVFRRGIRHHVSMAAAAAPEALYVRFFFHWQVPGLNGSPVRYTRVSADRYSTKRHGRIVLPWLHHYHPDGFSFQRPFCPTHHLVYFSIFSGIRGAAV